mgnify:CR=1 FL=1
MVNKYSVALLIFVLLLGSCEEPQNPDTIISSEVKVVLKSDKLFFSTHPQSSNRVKFWFPRLDDYSDQPLTQLIMLNKDSDTLAITPVNTAPFQKTSSITELEYDFKEGEFYQLYVDLKVNKDSIFRFQLPDYQHIIKTQMSVKPLAKFDRLGEFDLSPDREYLFLNDFANNEISTYRLEINSSQLLKLDDQLGTRLRAVDGNRVIYQNSGVYINDLFLYDIENSSSIPFGQMSSTGRVSRVIDGHLVYSNPIEDGNRTLTVVNLENDERRIIPDFDFGNTNREYIIGQKIFGNSIFDIETGTLSEELSPFQGTALLQYIPSEDLVFYIQGLGPEASQQGFSSKFVVGKKDQEPIFESLSEKSVTYYLPSETTLKDNKFLLYLIYMPNQDEHRISGFYQVDLSNGSIELVHSQVRLNFSPNGLVQLEDNLWLTLFSGEVELIQFD